MREFARLAPVLGLGCVAGTLGFDFLRSDQAAQANQAMHDLIAKECLPCHREGGIGRVRLDTSARIVNNRQLITKQLITGAMPPHSYESDFGFSAHARQLTDEDRLLVQRWRTATVIPFEPESAPLIRTARVESRDLGSPKPIPAIGDDVRRAHAFQFAGPISHIRIMAKAPASLRYSTIAVVSAPNRAAAVRVGQSSGTMSGIPTLFAARLGPPSFSMDTPLVVPKGAWIILVNHFKATGKPESDAVTVALTRGDKSLRAVTFTQLEHPSFQIPAKKTAELELRHQVAANLDLVSIMPEARYYCEEIKVQATAPDGTVQKLFHTRRWDFSFAPTLEFVGPVRLAKGTIVSAKFSYPNDDRCRMNEGRVPQLVKSGAGPDDEVCRLGLAMRAAN